jgi:hypothetical protein
VVGESKQVKLLVEIVVAGVAKYRNQGSLVSRIDKDRWSIPRSLTTTAIQSVTGAVSYVLPKAHATAEAR